MGTRGTEMQQLCRQALCLLLAGPSADPGGRRDVQQLLQRMDGRLCQRLGIGHAHHLQQALYRCQELFEVQAGNARNGATVRPTTALSVCRTHSSVSGSCPDRECPDLHVCAFFLLSGQCRYGRRCHFGHMLNSRHNRTRLQTHLLWGLHIAELRALFCLPSVRRGVTLPKVCKYYNAARGCAKGMNCHALHLCSDFIADQCQNAKRCDRNHAVDASQVAKVLTLYGVKVNRHPYDVLCEVRLYHQRQEADLDPEEQEEGGHKPVPGTGARPKRYGSVPSLFPKQDLSLPPGHRGAAGRSVSSSRTRSTSPSAYAKLANTEPFQTKTEELCLYYLKGKCRYKDNCQLLHSSLPYLWRLSPREEDPREGGGGGGSSDWRGLPLNSDQRLEEAYSQPHTTGCTVIDLFDDEVEVQFRNMTARNLRTGETFRVRRVSTLSAMHPSVKGATSSPHRHVATVWRWFWKNQEGVWLEFGEEETDRLPVSSSIVEERYQMSASTPMTFDRFVLDFGAMRLKDVDAGRKFKVRRRPQYQRETPDSDTDSG